MKMAEVAVAAVVKTAGTPSEKVAVVCTATAHLVPMLAGTPYLLAGTASVRSVAGAPGLPNPPAADRDR